MFLAIKKHDRKSRYLGTAPRAAHASNKAFASIETAGNKPVRRVDYPVRIIIGCVKIGRRF